MVSELERVYCYFVLPNIDSCWGWWGENDSRFCFFYRKNEEIVELITKGDSKAFDVDVLKAFIKLLPDNTEVSRKTVFFFFFFSFNAIRTKLSGRISHHSTLPETVLKLTLLKTDFVGFASLILLFKLPLYQQTTSGFFAHLESSEIHFVRFRHLILFLVRWTLFQLLISLFLLHL